MFPVLSPTFSGCPLTLIRSKVRRQGDDTYLLHSHLFHLPHLDLRAITAPQIRVSDKPPPQPIHTKFASEKSSRACDPSKQLEKYPKKTRVNSIIGVCPVSHQPTRKKKNGTSVERLVFSFLSSYCFHGSCGADSHGSHEPIALSGTLFSVNQTESHDREFERFFFDRRSSTPLLLSASPPPYAKNLYTRTLSTPSDYFRAGLD